MHTGRNGETSALLAAVGIGYHSCVRAHAPTDGGRLRARQPVIASSSAPDAGASARFPTVWASCASPLLFLSSPPPLPRMRAQEIFADGTSMSTTTRTPAADRRPIAAFVNRCVVMLQAL